MKHFDYSLLQSIVPGVEREHPHASDSENDDEQNTQAALIAKGRITSAHLYNLGPVTAERAYNIVRLRAIRTSSMLGKPQLGKLISRKMQGADALAITHKAQIRAFCVKDLAALLRNTRRTTRRSRGS